MPSAWGTAWGLAWRDAWGTASAPTAQGHGGKTLEVVRKRRLLAQRRLRLAILQAARR